MRNIDFYIDNIASYIARADCSRECSCSSCEDECICSSISRNKEQVKNWLLEEHNEKIKLKKWEYDYFQVMKEMVSKLDRKLIDADSYLSKLKEKGYFESVDLNMTVKEALDNCEIID